MNQSSTPQKSRLVALDVFRGLTIALMILVNTPGSWSHVYPFLLHAKWHGLLPADLVFPFFLFIIGVSMSFSFAKYSDGNSSPLIKKILKRSLLIFLIGVGLNYFPFYNKNLGDLRIMGVLQRIALAYCLASFVCVKVEKRNLWIVAIVLLIGYWITLVIFGSEHPFSLEGNISKTIDKIILGAKHLYRGFGIPFDPEGLLGTISASVSVILGYIIGVEIKQSQDNSLLIRNLLRLGVLIIVVGLAWDFFFPINKPLWSSSYVAITFGFACFFIGILIEIIDVRGYKKWTKPFLVFGVNPMILYVSSILLVKILIDVIQWESTSSFKTVNMYQWLYQNVFVILSFGNMKFASLMFAISTVAFCWAMGLVLYRKNIIIKV